ncbi:RelA/SpoT family protein [Desulfothermus sp.]
MIRITDILDKASKYMNQSELALIEKAYVYSASAHAGQFRLSGEPYLSHPLEVSNILVDLKLDAPTVASGLLHDTVEDTRVTIEDIQNNFGQEVADIVDGVTKIGKMTFESKQTAQAENIRKMILAMAKDLRVILVKLADRLHNMRTLEFQNPIKRRLISQETLEIYSPISHRLGLYKIKVELDDLSLKYLKPDVYNRISNWIKQHRLLGKDYVKKVISKLEQILEQNNIKGRVSGRQKHIYSIYQKMKKQRLPLDQVYDLIAFRIIVETIKDCYTTLGIVHSKWPPVPGRFKDYISMPKPNMYQSLHTTVIGPDGEQIEIQIRTEKMHYIAEYGVAAHWKYKDKKIINPKDEKRFSWLRQILDWERDLKDPKEFIQSLKIDLFEDEVYVFTPNRDVLALPQGATPVDFAYMIHSEVGDRCVGAKVNGKLVPLDTKLKNGDLVEIITNPNHKPSRDWLKFVKTAKAKARIRHWIKTEERATSISLAKEILEKEAKKLGINLQKELKKGTLEKVAEEFSYKTVEDLLVAVGYAKLTPKQVLNRLIQGEAKKPDSIKNKSAKNTSQQEAKETDEERKEGVVIRGAKNMLIRYAKCCQPVKGDPIVGYISRGRGTIVHTSDCPNVKNLEPHRLVEVTWAGEDNKTYTATIKIISKNQKGALALIAKSLSDEGINILSGSFDTKVDNTTEIFFQIEIDSSEHLYSTLEKLSKLPPVIEAIRTTGEIPKIN